MRSLRKFKIDFWMVASLVLAVTVVFSIRGGLGGWVGIRKMENSAVVLALAKDLYKDFVCFCCGKNIGDCTCEEAAEKRKMVDSFVEEFGKLGDLGKRKIYQGIIKKYGEEIMFNKALAAELKKELVIEAPKDRPIIALEPAVVDLGDVPQKNIISRDFKIKNQGEKDLIINGLGSSCGCTTARVANLGVEGPIFGMEGHGDFKNPTGWSTTIAPGAEAILRVFYDPNVHKDLKGAVTRQVTVFSNDEIEGKAKVTIELNQL